VIDRYILVDGEPKPCEDIKEWAEWFETAGFARVVKQTEIGDVEVSTVFLGLDHSFGQGAPILYETLVFGGRLDDEQVRYATRKEAEAGHEEMVGRMRKRYIDLDWRKK
jgi:hypothetical protein